MSIRFGQWELRPDKSGNWALHRLRADKEGNPKWLPCGRYFQWNTIGNALIYAANEEMMEKAEDEVLLFQGYAKELKRLLDSFSEDFRRETKESQ